MKTFAFTLLTTICVSWIGFCAAATPIQKIDTNNAPKALGAYSQAISVDLENTKNLIFVCGQVALIPKQAL